MFSDLSSFFNYKGKKKYRTLSVYCWPTWVKHLSKAKNKYLKSIKKRKNKRLNTQNVIKLKKALKDFLKVLNKSILKVIKKTLKSFYIIKTSLIIVLKDF